MLWKLTVLKEEDGVIVCDDPEVAKWIHHGERVSMNMWAAPAAFIDKLEAGFAEFLESLNGEAGEREYLLPDHCGSDDSK